MVGITPTFQIIIASIMCGYSKEDWTELAQMAEVIFFLKVYMTQKIFSAYLKGLSKCRRMAFFFLKYLFTF